MKKLDPKVIARLTPEKRALYEKQLARAKRNRKILTAVTAVIVVAAVCFVLSVTVLFNIKQITVEQTGEYYTAEEIISASGLDVGNNIIRTDFNNAANRIKMNLPYVYDVKILTPLSGTVKISITYGKQTMIVKCIGGYAVTDADGKVLEIIDDIPEDNQLTLITVKNEVTAKLGQTFTFSSTEEKEVYDSLKTALDNSELKEITAIDISNTNSIYVDYQNRFRLKLGTSSDLERKFQEAVKIIATEDEADPDTIAQINLSILKKVYVTPLETLDETTTAVSDETTTQENTETEEIDEIEETDEIEDDWESE